MKLLWTDIETTGLDPNRCDILEIACFLADFKRPWDATMIANLLIMPESFRFEDGCRTMHARSGLIRDVLEFGSKIEDVEAELVRLMVAAREPGESVMIAGSSVHFDLAFLRSKMPDFARMLHYRIFDVSVLRTWVEMQCEITGENKPDFCNPPDEKPHRAGSDVVVSIALGQACTEWLESRGVRVT